VTRCYFFYLLLTGIVAAQLNRLINSELQNIHNFMINALKSKYPIVRQYDQIDCGPAALLSVLKYYGGDSSLVHIRELCQTDVQGSTMLGIVQAAEKTGFEAYGAAGEYEELQKEQMPCIAHVVMENRLQHFLVIYKIDVDGVFVGDPGKGKYKLSKQEFLKIWQKKSVVLLKPARPLLNQKTPHWISWITTYLKKQEAWVTQSIFLGVVYTLIGLTTAIFVQWLIDRFIPEKSYEKIIYTGLFLLFILTLRATVGYIRGRFLVILNKRINLNITGDFLAHLFRLPKRFFDTRKTGDITARINDSLRIHQAILLFTNSTFIDGLIIVGSFSFMFYFSPSLALLALVTIPFYGILLFSKSRRIKSEQNEVMKSHAMVESTYINSIQGVNEIMSFNTARAFSGLNNAFFSVYQDKIEKLGFTQTRLSFAAELSGTVLTVLLLTIGAVTVVQGEIQLGQMMASYSLLMNILPSVTNLVGAYISIQGAHIAAKRLMDLLLVEQEKNVGTNQFVLKKDIKIVNASFAYPKGKPLFKNLNMTIEKGRITALWGPSGVGKSTLVQIIQRKYVLDEGQVLIDKEPAENINLQEYREKIAVIPQIIPIFNGTLADNILAGREITDPSEFNKRIKEIGLIGFLDRFEHGLFTLLGEEGRKLSGGETQLLGIARALFGNPELLIIDEGFSSIDVEIEQLISQLVRQFAQQKSVLLITHDLRSIIRAHFVYLFNQNGIIEAGASGELLSNNKSYLNSLCKKSGVAVDNKILNEKESH
jgi:ATP-binding cassette, subfamily C, bacteriocin exporter